MKTPCSIFSGIATNEHARAVGHVDAALDATIIGVAWTAVHRIAYDLVANTAFQFGENAVALITRSTLWGIYEVSKNAVVFRNDVRYLDALHVRGIVAKMNAIGINHHHIYGRELTNYIDTDGSLSIGQQDGILVDVVVDRIP